MNSIGEETFPLYHSGDAGSYANNANIGPIYTSLNMSAVLNKGPCVTVKAKMGNRYKQFYLPVSSTIIDLVALLKENFHVEYEGGASAYTAYILWLTFGWLGVHRFYLRQHNAGSFFVWFLTGQLFGLGWLYDGLTLYKSVERYNKKLLNKKYHEGHKNSFVQFMFGFKDDDRPSMIGAYLLWFFAGFFGAHRWYCGYQTAPSFFAWFMTGQMVGFGWLYDVYYTAHMVNHPKSPVSRPPFYVKTFDSHNDYMPVNTSEELYSVVSSANAQSDKLLRLIVQSRKNESVAYTLWFFTGFLGLHARYLAMDPNTFLPRLFTGNYFVFGWIVDGINLGSLIDEANDTLAGEFVPSWEGRKLWPLHGVVASTLVNMV